MPMRLLERLSRTRLPLRVGDADDIEKCCVLRAAKLIDADIPPYLIQNGRMMFAGYATVTCVTASGKTASAKRSHAPLNSPDFFPLPMKVADCTMSDRVPC